MASPVTGQTAPALILVRQPGARSLGGGVVLRAERHLASSGPDRRR